MVKFIEEGDVFNIRGVYNIAHGCNCAGAMGKGIALQFKKRFPLMYKEYKSMCLDGQFNLGDVYSYNYEKGYIFNLGTQKSWRTKADINAIGKSIDSMLYFSKKRGITKIALPKIGAGLGGLDWDDVKNKIIEASEKYPMIELFIIENYSSSWR